MASRMTRRIPAEIDPASFFEHVSQVSLDHQAAHTVADQHKAIELLRVSAKELLQTVGHRVQGRDRARET